jgi:hypothetical protein
MIFASGKRTMRCVCVGDISKNEHCIDTKPSKAKACSAMR